MKHRTYLFIVVLLFVSAQVFAFSADIDRNPPSWRGLEGSTVQGWEFGTDDRTPSPDLLDNDYGIPELKVIPTAPFYQDTWGGRAGIWHLSGVITANIDNSPIRNPYKYIQIQFVWAGELPTATPCVAVSAWLDENYTVPAQEVTLMDTVVVQLEPTGVPDAGEYWYYSSYLYKIIPNPKVEQIVIGGAVWIDGVIIDTICIPEPATLVMLSLASLALFNRRK